MVTLEGISIERAREIVLTQVPVLEAEEANLLDAVGRVVAWDVRSDIDVSSFRHSARDGFAVDSAQLRSASSESCVTLEVVAEIPAGSHYDKPIGPGECARIMCGAPMPDGADAVVMFEDVGAAARTAHASGRVAFDRAVQAGLNVRQAGALARAGEVILHAGSVVQPLDVALLADCGATRLMTYRRPRVGVIATGSELVDAGEVPAFGKIRASNGYALGVLAQAAGATCDILPPCPDDPVELQARMLDAAQTCDVVVMTGGSCVGDCDFSERVIGEVGNLAFSSVNLKPGSGPMFGMVSDVPVFGLSGNPGASTVGFELLVRPALRMMQGYKRFDRPRMKARITHDEKNRTHENMFRRATLSLGGDGAFEVTSSHNMREALLDGTTRPNCYLFVPENVSAYRAGDEVECVLLDVSEDVALVEEGQLGRCPSRKG